MSEVAVDEIKVGESDEQKVLEMSDEKVEEVEFISEERNKLRYRLVTSALPYINNVPHLGHIVGSHLPADIFARYSRQKGIKTLLIGGSDEHGTPSEIAAEQLGIDHKVFCDVLHGVHDRIYKWFGISYDNYSRTGSAKHKEIVQRVFNEIKEAGHISKETIEMFYDPEAKRFLADRYIEGTCPKCGFEKASGDQCEVCTNLLDTKEIINPKSKLTGATPELKETEHLFLDLGAFGDSLREWIEAKTDWRPQVRNLALGWLDSGLRKRGITRDLKHGIEVPMEGMEGKVLYVWFEAPIAYISFLAEIEENWEMYWGKNEEGEDRPEVDIYHFLGKDNIPFHTIFWPAILKAAGKYRMPDHVAGMQYLNYEGEKFSKSKRRGVFCESLLDSDVNPDLLRAYLAMIIPEKADSEFGWDDFKQQVNKNLIDILSNFIYRSTSFSYKKFDGKVAKPGKEALTDLDKKLMSDIDALLKEFERNMDAVQVRAAIKNVFDLASLGNKYIDEAAPWSAIKTDNLRAQHILYMCSYLAKNLSVLLASFLPDTSNRIWTQMNFEGKPFDTTAWTDLGNFDNMPQEQETQKPEMLFVRITDEEMAKIKEQLSKLKDLQEFFK